MIIFVESMWSSEPTLKNGVYPEKPTSKEKNKY